MCFGRDELKTVSYARFLFVPQPLTSLHTRPSTMCSSFITPNSTSSLVALPPSHWISLPITAATSDVRLSSTSAPDHPTLSDAAGGAAMLQCYVCSKTFNRVYSLDRHMMIHTGERPFPCQYCPYKANQKIVLQKHLSRIHGIHRTSETEETSSTSIVTTTFS